MDLSLSLLLIRFTVGLVVMAHGAQKLVGIGGGPGLRGWITNVGKMGFQPAPLWGLVSVSAEFLGGTALAVGFFTPVAAALIVGEMFVAIVKAHWHKGFWVKNGGLEYPFVLAVVSAAIGLGGPGRYSVDATLGWDGLSGAVFGPLLALALIVDALMIRSAPTPAPARTAPAETAPGPKERSRPAA
jgi:putative oxidoreductase